MNDNLTPETDHLENELGTAAEMSHPILWAHTRKLESERDEARELVAELKCKISDYCDEQLRLVFENRRLHQERDEARERLAKITKSAEAVIDRWEQPAWKDTEPTAAVIYRLRDALGR